MGVDDDRGGSYNSFDLNRSQHGCGWLSRARRKGNTKSNWGGKKENFDEYWQKENINKAIHTKAK